MSDSTYTHDMDDAKKHFQWCMERALKLYEAENTDSAIASFVSDTGKHEGTKHINERGFMTMMILRDALGSREDFIKAMKGFNI
jgi:hypothetical protein